MTDIWTEDNNKTSILSVPGYFIDDQFMLHDCMLACYPIPSSQTTPMSSKTTKTFWKASKSHVLQRSRSSLTAASTCMDRTAFWASTTACGVAITLLPLSLKPCPTRERAQCRAEIYVILWVLRLGLWAVQHVRSGQSGLHVRQASKFSSGVDKAYEARTFSAMELRTAI